MQTKLNNFTWMPSKSNLPFFIEKLNRYGDSLLDFEITVTRRKSKRSLEQNARLWSLYKNIGNLVGVTDDDMHNYMGNKFLKIVKIINDEEVMSIESTTKLSTERMAEYQTKIEAWAAAELGWAWES